MPLRILLIAAGLVLVAAVAILLRGAVPTVIDGVADSRVSVECTGWTGVSADCEEWGSAVLARGAPSRTFEMEDVNRIVLDRAMFGFAAECEARYFLSRYPDEPAWTEPVACAG